MTKSQYYLEAIKILEENGWCQRSLTNKLGEHCLAGALMLACPSKLYSKEYHKLREEIERHLKVSSIAAWNDYYTRSRDDVINLLKEMAEKS